MLLVLILFGKQGLRLLAFVVGVSSLRDEHCSVLKERSYTETLPFVLIPVRLLAFMVVIIMAPHFSPCRLDSPIREPDPSH